MPESVHLVRGAMSALIALSMSQTLWAQTRATMPAVAEPPRPLSLGEAVRLAAERNPAVEAAQARGRQADARVRQRRADLFPSLSAAAVQSSRTFNTSTLGFAFKGPNGVPLFNPKGEVGGPVHTTDLRGRLNQGLVDLGAIERVRASRFAADAAGTEAEVAAEQAAAMAAVAYLRIVRSNALLAARQADSTISDSLLGIARDQVRAGTGVALDVTRARAQASQIRAQLIGARLDRDRASIELARVLSLPRGAAVVVTDSLVGLTMEIPDDAAFSSHALVGRTEVRSLEAQIVASDHQEKALRRERLPVLSAFADNGPIAGEGGSFLRTYVWGVQLSVPIFDGFRRDGRIEEQLAVRLELDARRRDLQQQVMLDIDAALLDVASAREQLAVARERVALAEQELSQAGDRFRAGVAGNADVVSASLGLNGARTLVIEALYSFQAGRIAIARAQGRARTLR